VYGSVTDEFFDSANPISKPDSAWICCIYLKIRPFCDILPIVATVWLPWKRPLHPCNKKYLLWIGRPRKPRPRVIISNHILTTSRRNAFICIYSSFSPKIGCRRNAPLSLVYGSVTDEFPIAQTLSQNQTLHGYVAYNDTTEVMAIFRDKFCLCWPKFGCHGNVP